MSALSWYRGLEKADRNSLSNLTYGPAGVVLCVVYASQTHLVLLWVLAGFFLLALTLNNLNDLVLLARYREYRKAVRSDLDELAELLALRGKP